MGFDDDHIADSRTLEFEEKFSSASGVVGGLVLNSLAGEFTDASLRLLAPAVVFSRWARPIFGRGIARP